MAVVLACLLVAAGCSEDPEPRSGNQELPKCAALANEELGPVESDPAWKGCATEDGSALQSYQFVCSALGDRFAAREGETPIVFIPDAGLVGAAGQEWQSVGYLAAYHRTPFDVMGPEGCTEMQSIPQDWPIRVACDLDAVPIDFLTLQGCEREGTYYPAVGRACTFVDGDVNATWEQWWIDAPPEDYGNGSFVLETDGMTERWSITPDSHRDDRCATAPKDWSDDWRHPG